MLEEIRRRKNLESFRKKEIKMNEYRENRGDPIDPSVVTDFE